MRNLIVGFLLLLRSMAVWSQSHKEIDFVSDTQQPMAIEKLKLRANHNELATAMIFSDIIKNRPFAVYMLGDVVSLGSSNQKWKNVDKFLDTCRDKNISVHALLGNHDVMWTRAGGEKKFQKRFPDHRDLGYLSIADSIAIILLNSNFKKLSRQEIDKQEMWYAESLKKMNDSHAIKAIIVCCHHAPYTNSKIVGPSKKTQQYFVDGFLKTKKCCLFITGHAHAFEHFKFSGKDFLVIGGGGGLHQPLDSSANRLPDLASSYKPMFHYLSLERTGNKLWLTSHFLKADFSSIEKGYSFEVIAAQ